MTARRLLLCAMLAWPSLAEAAPDPLEPVNRRIHAFNQLVQAYALAPLAALWREQVPEPARQGIGHAVANLGEPLTALSGLAAGEFGLAWHATARFGINATLGWGGWRDAAAERGWERRRMAPGEAACAWGVPSGPYLVLPLLGPSNLRDASARIAAGALFAQGVGVAPELERIARQSLDDYAVLRSVQRQQRAARCAADRTAAEE
jgi:phospholipid-binding lipoprotein MlaA